MMALEGLERVLQVEETRELIRREQEVFLLENGNSSDTPPPPSRTPTLVSASLIETARTSHTSSAVTKRADRIWKQHFVSCALCKRSYSKHRPEDAAFCPECKCHVCSQCNCQVYHLQYQEELWAATEEKSEAKKNAKKSKNKKKKAKLKEKKKQQDLAAAAAEATEVQQSKQPPKVHAEPLAVPADPGAAAADRGPVVEQQQQQPKHDDNNKDDEEQDQVDLVLYLQQTGSMIALAKLMDALDLGGALDDYERKMIQEQQQGALEQQ